jgi:hypothetical protein
VKNWKAWAALVALAALIYFMVFHWGRFQADFWPIDNSHVAPNLLASLVQWALVAIVVALLYPPARRAIERFAKYHVDSIKEHVSQEHAAVHDKMDHIIRHHPDIPDFVPREKTNDTGG